MRKREKDESISSTKVGAAEDERCEIQRENESNRGWERNMDAVCLDHKGPRSYIKNGIDQARISLFFFGGGGESKERDRCTIEKLKENKGETNW